MLTISLLLFMSTAAKAAPIEVTVSHLPGDRWRAEYRFNEAVPAVKFDRRFLYRSEWEVETEGLEFLRIGEADLVVGEAPFDRFTITFPSNTRHLTKNYELVDRFTEGSVILYTGHLDVYPVEPDPGGGWETAARIDRRERPVTDMQFVPLAGEQVRVPGGDGDRYASSEAGVYVYFGTLEPVQSEHIVAFVDPGLPDNLRETFDRYLPRLFQVYTQRLEQPLAQRPTVYLSAVPVDTGYSTRGGVTGGVVQLAVEANFDDPPSALGENLVHLIAHEAAHLWNGGKFHHRQLSGSSWMHEGSADALAERALLEIGYYDSDDLAARTTQQATKCARGLLDTRLVTATEGGRFDLMYACGAIAALLTERGWADGDLFDFWSRLFAAANDDGEYTVADYMALAWQLAGPETADALYRLVHEPLDDPFEFLRSAMVEAGLEVEIGTGAASDDRAGSQKALAHLVAQDCRGGYSIYTEADALKVRGLPTCTRFQEGEFYPVTQVDGISVHSGMAVDAAIAKHCGTDRPVPLTLTGGDIIEVPCPAPWNVDRRRLEVSAW